MSTLGLGGILLTPYLGWSLYWGWGPVWDWWRNHGFFFFTSNVLPMLILLCLFFELLVLIAIVYSACIGIGRYRLARRIVTSAD